VLTKFVLEIQRLMAAYQLLEQIWLEIGPYDEEKIFKDNPKLRIKLNNFMGFNDNE
jgi:hypothetical protein